MDYSNSPVECAICSEDFNETTHRPKVLQCGHSFCCSCLERCFDEGEDSCGICRSPHNARSVNDIPVNFSMQNLLQMRSPLVVLKQDALKEAKQNLDHLTPVTDCLERVMDRKKEIITIMEVQVQNIQMKIAENKNILYLVQEYINDVKCLDSQLRDCIENVQTATEKRIILQESLDLQTKKEILNILIEDIKKYLISKELIQPFPGHLSSPHTLIHPLSTLATGPPSTHPASSQHQAPNQHLSALSQPLLEVNPPSCLPAPSQHLPAPSHPFPVPSQPLPTVYPPSIIQGSSQPLPSHNQPLHTPNTPHPAPNLTPPLFYPPVDHPTTIQPPPSPSQSLSNHTVLSHCLTHLLNPLQPAPNLTSPPFYPPIDHLTHTQPALDLSQPSILFTLRRQRSSISRHSPKSLRRF
ncbi:unnamed protein product, partial [Meganyctiphanes norvegica]